MAEPTLFTVGYEKAALSDLLDTLVEAGIRSIVDVRERPQSRRAGFSKGMLASSAAARNIDYLHLRPLGTPPEGRAAHRSGDKAAFRQIVMTQLATAEAQAALETVRALAIERPVCLLCYEANWRDCHRAEITALLAPHGIAATHLTVEPRFG